MTLMAVLDDKGVYLGMEDVDEPTERHLPQITECDLTPGEYTWQANPDEPLGGRFLPIPKKKDKSILTDADATRAMAHAFLAIQAQGFKIPKQTSDWLKVYTASFDFKGE